MALLKTEAVILRSRRQGETSKILSFYTENYGKQSIIAKGSRSIKSQYLGVLEPLHHVAVVFYHKENRSVQFLSQAEIVESFPKIHNALGKMSLAAIACELIEKSEIGDHENPHLFRLLIGFLRSLENSQANLKNFLRVFYLKFLHISGFQPALLHCADCGNQNADQPVKFSLSSGTYSCSACSESSAEHVELSSDMLKYLRWYDAVAMENADQAKISAVLGRQVDSFLLNYIRYHIAGLEKLNSIKYLEQIQEGLSSKK